MQWVLAAVLSLVVVVCTDGSGQAQPVSASEEAIAPMVLNGYSRFPQTIGSAPVYDMNAHQVGSLQKLQAAPDGQPSAIEVWLPSGRTFTVTASNVSYDEQHNSVTVGLDDAQLGLNTAPAAH